jgi:ribonuclease P protein component
LTASAVSERLPRCHRLRKRPEFLALQEEGRRRVTAAFVVLLRTRPAPPSRLGITTSRKIGNAPRRNRVRRLVREFFRRHQYAVQPPADILVIARPGAAALGAADVARQLAQALQLPT